MWITKVEFTKHNTNKEALESSLNTIKEWCEENNCIYDLNHNTEIGSHRFNGNFNRCVGIKTQNGKRYLYQLVIHKFADVEYYKEYDEALSRLLNRECYSTKQKINGCYYQAELIRRL